MNSAAKKNRLARWKRAQEMSGMVGKNHALLERIRELKSKEAKSKKKVEPEPPDTSDLPELPDGWCWATLGSTFEVYTGGTPA